LGLDGEILGSEYGIWTKIGNSTYLIKAGFWVPNGQILLIKIKIDQKHKIIFNLILWQSKRF
jgi:hypothetical protein